MSVSMPVIGSGVAAAADALRCAATSACYLAAAVRFWAASAAARFRSSAAVRGSSTSRSFTARASLWSSIALSRLAFSSSSACSWFWIAVASSWAARRSASLRSMSAAPRLHRRPERFDHRVVQEVPCWRRQLTPGAICHS